MVNGAWNRVRDSTLPRRQRLEMYMVISMPKRRSTARGVSHFMMPPSVPSDLEYPQPCSGSGYDWGNAIIVKWAS